MFEAVFGAEMPPALRFFLAFLIVAGSIGTVGWAIMWAIGRSGKSYIAEILRPGETILTKGKLHWIIFLPAITCVAVAVIVAVFLGLPGIVVGLVFGLIALSLAAKEWLQRWITEIAVTDHRVIYKTGLIRRHTAEMNMDKVESVVVDQSIIGRLLGYGSVHVRGTGEGLEHLHYISSPISLRNTITAR
jgi:uncharacterized membrane protein YdbT with pleckstrin-like domain